MPNKKNRDKLEQKKRNPSAIPANKQKLNYWIVRLQTQLTVSNIAIKECMEAINSVVPLLNTFIEDYDSEIEELKNQLKELRKQLKKQPKTKIDAE